MLFSNVRIHTAIAYSGVTEDPMEDIMNRTLLEMAVEEATLSFLKNNKTPESMLTFVAANQRGSIERVYETACKMYLNMPKSPDVFPPPELPAEFLAELSGRLWTKSSPGRSDDSETKIHPSSTNVCLADFVFLPLTFWRENDIL